MRPGVYETCSTFWRGSYDRSEKAVHDLRRDSPGTREGKGKSNSRIGPRDSQVETKPKISPERAKIPCAGPQCAGAGAGGQAPKTWQVFSREACAKGRVRIPRWCPTPARCA